MSDPEAPFAPRLVFRVAGIELNEATRELTVDGQRRVLEAKPLALLQALLGRAGARVGKRELIEAVWGNADHISETSLTTAMSKLRAALGERGRELIDVVPGSGYRIAAAVEVSTARPAAIALVLQPGDPVPGRPQWRLARLLGSPALNDVWLAEHEKTAEARVFKFADSAARLQSLQREAALSRLLHATLGPRDDLVRVVEWNFEHRPYFLESPYGGLSLPGFAAAQGGLCAVKLDQRLAWLARVARTLAAAHGAGVLHGDIKPANILVDPTGPGAPTLRLVDFGAGGLNDPTRLADFAISLDGTPDLTGPRISGTLPYLAPEILAGGRPTAAADIYALGILLFQLVVADLERPLALGFEADITDPLLREDIAQAACGDPARRLPSAASLAERLETLPSRRADRQKQAQQAARAQAALRELERLRLRRPWIRLAACSMVAGLALSIWFGWRAIQERDAARAQAGLVQAVNSFLTEDLLGRGNPANSGTADESLMDAAQAAESGIDRRLGRDPLVAGAIYLALARAFDSRSAYGPARTAYDRAIAAFARAGPAGRADAIIASLHEASMLVVTGAPGSLAAARRQVAAMASRVATLGARRAEAQIWLDASRGMLEMLGGDVEAAEADYTRAADGASAMPRTFDLDTRLALRQRQAFTAMRLGHWQQARALFQDLLARRVAFNGPRAAATLIVQLHLAQIDIGQGQPGQALPRLDRIYPDFVSVFGASHLRTLLLLATRALAEDRLGQYDRALADERAVMQLGAQRFGDHGYIAVGGLADRAATLCRAGRLAVGLQAASQAHDLAATWFGPAAPLTQIASVDLAFCRILAGQYEAALPLLDGIDPKSLGELTMDRDYGAELDLMRAAAQLGLGHTEAGTQLLDRVGPRFDGTGADPFLRAWVARLRHAGA